MAVEVTQPDGTSRYFITWGRVHDPVDPVPLDAVVFSHCSGFGVDGARARICPTLQSALEQPYFYETLFNFAGQRPPFGPAYEAWRDRIKARMADGHELQYLGAPTHEVS